MLAPCPEQARESTAHKLVMERLYLGQISRWSGQGLPMALALAKSIGVVMNTLFPEDEAQELSWSVSTAVDGSTYGKEERIYFTVKRNEKTQKWEPSVSELEAALSLRLYAIYQCEEVEVNARPTSAYVEKQVDMFKDDETGLRKPSNLSILTRNNSVSRRDFAWWLEDGTTLIETEEEKEVENPLICGKDSPWIEVEAQRVLGCGSGDRKSPRPFYTYKTLPFKPDNYYVTNHKEGRGARNKWLATVNEASLENAIALDWFSAFMWAAAKRTKPLTGAVTRSRFGALRVPHDERPRWSVFRLKHDAITAMAQGVESSGLGSLKEGHLRVVAPLSYYDRLPSAENELAGLTLREANKLMATSDFIQVGKLYLWLFQTCMTFGCETPAAAKGAAMLVEFFRFVCRVNDNWLVEMRQGEKVEQVKRILKEIQHQLEKHANHPLMVELIDLCDLQGRLEEVSELRSYRRMWTAEATTSTIAESTVSRAMTRGRLSYDCQFSENMGYKSIHKEVLRGDDSSFEVRKFLDMINAKDVFDWSPLHYAAAHDNEVISYQLLQSGADPKAKDFLGYNPLHYAAHRGNKATVQSLLYGGGEFQAPGIDGLTPLHCAAMGGHPEVVSLLLGFGALVDVRDTFGKTPLHWAAFYGHRPVVEVLLSHDASMDTADENGRSSVHFGAMNTKSDDWELVDLLQKKTTRRDHVDRDQATPLHLSAALGNTAINNMMIHNGLNRNSTDKNKSTSLHIAAEMAHWGTIKNLLWRTLACAEMKDKEGNTPVHLAIRSGFEIHALKICERLSGALEEKELTPAQGQEATQRLDKAKAELLQCTIPNGEGRYHRGILHDLVALDSSAQLAELLSLSENEMDMKGISVDAPLRDRSTPLHVAVRKGNRKLVNLLLNRHATANAVNMQRITPLHIAVNMEKVELATILLERGADPNLMARHWGAPLHQAAKASNVKLLALLLKHGADRNSMCKGKTPLHLAVMHNKKKIVKLLLDAGADPEIPTSDGDSCLHLTVKRSHDIARFLLDRGIPRDVSNNALDTPLHKAVRSDDAKMVELLVTYGPADSDGPRVDVNSREAAQKTPLHLAAAGGNIDIARLLISHNAEIQPRDNSQETPFLIAVRKGDAVMGEILCDAGADIEGRSGPGEKPMHIVAELNHVDFLRLLLKKGAERECRTVDNGRTPLHHAARFGGTEVARILIEEEKVDVNLRDRDDATPFRLAEWKKHKGVLDILKKNGGEIGRLRKG